MVHCSVAPQASDDDTGFAAVLGARSERRHGAVITDDFGRRLIINCISLEGSMN